MTGNLFGRRWWSASWTRLPPITLPMRRKTRSRSSTRLLRGRSAWRRRSPSFSPSWWCPDGSPSSRRSTDFRSSVLLHTQDRGRTHRKSVARLEEGEPSGHHQLGENDGERRLQADRPRRSLVELLLLVFRRMGSVIGGNRVQDALHQRRPKRLPVIGGPKWRVHPERCVVGDQVLVEEGQMVRRDVGGQSKPPLLALPDEVDRLSGRDVGDVEPSSREPGQRQVPPDNDGLRLRGHTREPEKGGVVALVHLPPLAEARVLGVLTDHHVEDLRVLEGEPHDAGRLHTVAVVGEQAHAGFGQLRDVRE